MSFSFEQRLAESPLVDRIWSTQTKVAGSFTSLAANQWEIVVTKYQGKTSLTIRGPETQASLAHCPAQAEFFGIVFKPGVFMPHLSLNHLLNGQDVSLPLAGNKTFWLKGSAWELPNYANADTFIAQLVRQGLLVQDRIVEQVLQNRPSDLSTRTLRRHFLQATGLTPATFYQIERARQALTLLQQGVSILDTVIAAGYYDQPHLTRALKHFTGQTPAQILTSQAAQPMSLLYKTN